MNRILGIKLIALFLIVEMVSPVCAENVKGQAKNQQSISKSRALNEHFDKKELIGKLTSWKGGCLFQDGPYGAGDVVMVTDPFSWKTALMNIHGEDVQLTLKSENMPEPEFTNGRSEMHFSQLFSNEKFNVRVDYSGLGRVKYHAQIQIYFNAIITVQVYDKEEKVSAVGRCGL